LPIGPGGPAIAKQYYHPSPQGKLDSWTNK